jgi:uncharacterized protein YeaO (DUF488 family)
MLNLKRAYKPAFRDDGKRFLVERLWPRGVKKSALHLDGWLKDIAPSSELRIWFNHDVTRWPEFQQRYRAELEQHSEMCNELIQAAKRGTLTLVYGSRETEHNCAVVLRDYLQQRLTVKKLTAKKKRVPGKGSRT